jgi:hypothetical protein
MTPKLTASLLAVPLLLGPSAASAAPAATRAGPAAVAHQGPGAPHGRPQIHRRGHGHGFWPGVADGYYGPSYADPVAEPAPAASADLRHTYVYDVPWDWAHRYPPAVAPSDRPYVARCTDQAVTVPRRIGSTETVAVNVTRCY